MIRYYCDRCDSEVKWSSDLCPITLPKVENNYNFTNEKESSLCRDCLKNIREYENSILKVVVNKIDYDKYKDFYLNAQIVEGKNSSQDSQ